VVAYDNRLRHDRKNRCDLSILAIDEPGSAEVAVGNDADRGEARLVGASDDETARQMLMHETSSLANGLERAGYNNPRCTDIDGPHGSAPAATTGSSLGSHLSRLLMNVNKYKRGEDAFPTEISAG
jgi:hypothetical protein